MNEVEKPVLLEAKAAALFVFETLDGVTEHWDSIMSELRPLITKPCEQLASPWSAYYFALANIAGHLQTLPNLFPGDQARRLREGVLACLRAPELGTEAIELVEQYENAWKRASEEGRHPWDDVAALLYDSLGLNETCVVAGERYKNPVLLLALGTLVTVFGGPWWKEIRSKCALVP